MRYLVHVRALIAGLVLLAGSGLALGGAEPPDVINYQGVLCDAAGHPLSGDFEMIFRFVDAGGGPGTCAGGKVPGAACTVATDCPGGCSINGAVNCNSTAECLAQSLGKCVNPPPGTCGSELAREEHCAVGGPAPCTVETAP
jgi:hypothetical protein